MTNEKIKRLSDIFRGKGYNPVVGNIYMKQEESLNWYRGEVNDFHYFTIKTISGHATSGRKASLNMGKKVCEDWSSLLWNEKNEFIGGTYQEDVDRIFEANNIQGEMSNFVELASMYGVAMPIEYIADDEVKVQFVYGDELMVIDYENTTITSAAVLREFKEGGMNYTHVQYLSFKNGIFRIEHELYGTRSGVLGNKTNLNVLFTEDELDEMYHVTDDGEEQYYIEYITLVPHYQIFKWAISNNFDVNSPMTLGVLANSISVLEGCDNAYHSFVSDGLLSRKRILVSDKATKQQKNKKAVTVDGETKYIINSIRYFDPDDTVFQSMDLPEEKPIEIFAPEFNSEPHVRAIQMNLDLLSSKVGLGTGYYSFSKEGGMTATEVIHKNSDTWRNRQKQVNALRDVLIRMMYSTVYLDKVINGEETPDVDIEQFDVKFDDSIIVDDNKLLDDMKNDAVSGVIPKWRYVMEKYKITQDEAKEWVKEAQEEDDNANFSFFQQLDEEDS